MSAADSARGRLAVGGLALAGGVLLQVAAIAAVVLRHDRAGAALALAGAVLAALAPLPPASDRARRDIARAYPRRIAALLLPAGLALTVGVVDAIDGRGTAPLWLLWLGAFSLQVQGYGDVVFARSIRAIGARPQRFGAVRADGSVVGLADPAPWWASTLAAPAVALSPLVAAYLAFDHPRWLAIAIGAWYSAAMLFSSVVRGRVMWILDAPSRASRPEPPRLSGAERRAHLRTGLEQARDSAFWGLVIARPLAALWLYPVADVRWLTPNVVTVVSIATCLAAGAVGGLAPPAWAALAVVLIFIRSVLDSFDGQLARYRKLSSHFGGYFDKVSDSFGWAALYAAAAAAGYEATGEPLVLLAPLAAATALSFQGVSYWLERDMFPPSAPTPLSSGRSPVSLVGWLINWWRLAIFEEPDYYFWISLALVTGWHRELAVLLAVTFGLRVTLLSLRRLSIAWRVARAPDDAA